MALSQVRHCTLPFRKAANALATDGTTKALDVHRPFFTAEKACVRRRVARLS